MFVFSKKNIMLKDIFYNIKNTIMSKDKDIIEDPIIDEPTIIDGPIDEEELIDEQVYSTVELLLFIAKEYETNNHPFGLKIAKLLKEAADKMS